MANQACTSGVQSVPSPSGAFPDAVPGRLDPAILDNDTVLRNLLSEEERHIVQTNYFKLNQPYMEPRFRKVVTEWMRDVCLEEFCDAGTFPLAVSYLDRFLSVQTIHVQQLQILATACLFVASKFCQNRQIPALKLVAYTDDSITVRDLMSWELLLLGRLRWDVSSVTAVDFVDHILLRLCLNSKAITAKLRKCANDLIAIVATEYVLATLPPSVIACGCICMALQGFVGGGIGDVTSTLIHILQPIMATEADMLRTNVEAIESFLINYLKDKYGKDGVQLSNDIHGNDDNRTPTNSLPPLPHTDFALLSQSLHHNASFTPTDMEDVADTL